MQSFLHLEKFQVHKCYWAAAAVTPLWPPASRHGCLRYIIMDSWWAWAWTGDWLERMGFTGGDPSTLQWNYVKLHSLSSSCLTEFVFVYALAPIHNPKPPPTRWPLHSTCMPRSNYYVKEVELLVGESPNQHFMPRRRRFLISHGILKIQANRMKMWRTLNEAVKDI